MRLAVLYWSRGDFRVETRPSCPFSNLIVLFWFFVSASSVSWESLKRIRLRLGRSPIPNDYHVSADPAQCWLRNGCWTLPAKCIAVHRCQRMPVLVSGCWTRERVAGWQQLWVFGWQSVVVAVWWPITDPAYDSPVRTVSHDYSPEHSLLPTMSATHDASTQNGIDMANARRTTSVDISSICHLLHSASFDIWGFVTCTLKILV